MKRTQSTTTLAFWMKYHCFNNEEYINKRIEEVQKELETFKAELSRIMNDKEIKI